MIIKKCKGSRAGEECYKQSDKSRSLYEINKRIFGVSFWIRFPIFGLGIGFGIVILVILL